MADDLQATRARRVRRQPRHARHHGFRRGRHSRQGRRSDGPNESRRAWGVALITTVLLLGAAGTSVAFTSTTVADPRVTHAAKVISQAAPTGGATCPLSGLPAPGGRLPQRPALAIKIDNYPDARPQSGLNQADIVFEEQVEGGITRFVAVFQCNESDLVGPIRSAREVDAQILDELSDPIFVHVGGIPPVLSLISDSNDTDENINNIGPPAQNPSGQVPPYDTYISTAAGWALEPSDTKPPAPLFSYSSSPPKGTSVTSVNVPFSSYSDNTWTWSSSQGLWLLSYGGTPATLADGSQISATNIVIQSVQISYGPWAENSLGALEVESQLTGSGALMVFRNGREVTGTWERASLDQPTRLMASNGSVIPLQPGETWVELVPNSITVSTTAPSSSSNVSP